MSQTLSLRDYQERGIESLRQGFIAGHRSQLLCIPTGGGKTECAIALMHATARNYKRASMILDRVVLCDQTSKRLDRYSIPHGVMQADHWRYRPYERIQVCSAQTLESRGVSPDTDLLIVDECHATRKGTVELIQANPRIRVIGLTATPFTKGLGELYTNVVCPITMHELVQAGSLVPLRVFIAQEADMAGAKKFGGEWTAADATAAGNKIVGDVVTEWVKITHQVFGKPEKSIVFCASVDHAQTLSDRFRDAGYNFIPLTYRDDGDYKRDIIDAFSEPDTKINGLIAVDILTKGFDVPDVRIAVSARPFSKSLSSHVQQIGRIVRAAPGKEFGVWIDHSGNFLRFREQYETLYFDGVRSLGDGALQDKPVREKTEKEKKEAKCPKCGALRLGPMCVHCGFEFPARSMIEEVSGTVSEIDVGADIAERIKREAFFRELLRYCLTKGYSAGWAANKFKDRYGIWPKYGNEPADSISEDTAKWIKHLNIKLAKRKRR